MISQLFKRTPVIFMLGLLGTTVGISLSSNVHAQQQQTLGECIADLRRQGFYSKDAADRCEKLNVQRQTLGECIADLRRQGFYSKDAADRCQKLLELQTRPQRPSPDPSDRPPVLQGGNPEAIASCMKKLMYERRFVCTRSSPLVCFNPPQDGFGGWQIQNVRTDISETAAVQACQNAR